MINKLRVSGNLTKDPEITYTPQGTALTKFTIASVEIINQNKITNFVPCIAWGDAALYVGDNLKKGNSVLLVGTVKTGSFEGQDGNRVYTTDLRAEIIKPLNHNNSNGDIINEFTGIGRLTKDPEITYTPQGTAKTRITIAITDGFGENAQTDFISMTLWGKKAEYVGNYLKKGYLVYTEGSFKSGSYDNQQGVKVYTKEIACSNIQNLQAKKTEPSVTVDEGNLNFNR